MLSDQTELRWTCGLSGALALRKQCPEAGGSSSQSQQANPGPKSMRPGRDHWHTTAALDTSDGFQSATRCEGHDYAVRFRRRIVNTLREVPQILRARSWRCEQPQSRLFLAIRPQPRSVRQHHAHEVQRPGPWPWCLHPNRAKVSLFSASIWTRLPVENIRMLPRRVRHRSHLDWRDSRRGLHKSEQD